MKQIPGSDDKALFVEVPTPVNAMSAEEKRDFAEEILRALEIPRSFLTDPRSQLEPSQQPPLP